jgi:sigma-E factor negative regulatory protein RseA
MNDTMAPGADNRSDDISALADGALRGEAFAAALDRLAHDEQARACWHAYHVVGDVLRCPDLAASCTGDADFLGRLQTRLALEPQPARVVVPVVALPLAAQAAVHAAAQAAARPTQAANSDSFRWKMMAGFASVAAVAAIGWNTLAVSQPGSPAVLALAAPGTASQQQGSQHPVLQARAEAGSTVSAPAVDVATGPGEGQVMIRNAQLDELLAAHNQAIGGAALQSQARFVRNANFQDLPR